MARPGGESDKFGNTYEGAWTVHHMLLVLAGRAKAIIVEDIGDRARWLRDRVDGVVETLTGTTIRAASAEGGGVQLALDGARETRMEVDHVMCGTGFPRGHYAAALLPEGTPGEDHDRRRPPDAEPRRRILRPWPVLRRCPRRGQPWTLDAVRRRDAQRRAHPSALRPLVASAFVIQGRTRLSAAETWP